jgi:signal transduction histidine kinase
MTFSARPQFVAVCLAILWGLGTFLGFRYLGARAEDEIRGLAAALATRFEKSWVSRPDDEGNKHLFRTMRGAYFDELDQSQQIFRQVWLTWVNPEIHREVILYPTDWIGRQAWQINSSNTIRIEIRDRFHQPPAASGYLYFQYDPWLRLSTPVTFLLAAFNVLFLMMMLLYWLSRLSRRYEQSQSELRQKKLELIHLEQLALAGKLSAGLLHDLKKPVIHIREECREAPASELVSDVREQSELFLNMLRDSGLEDFARRRSVEPECCDAIDLIQRSLRLVAYERNDVQVDLDAGEDVPLVWAHPTRLVQVFSNLILNAYQAMRGRGTLTLRVCGVGVEGRRQVEVTISDTGPGIPSEHAVRVFDPFFTTGKEGSGLGLYITRTILEDLGGSIGFESPPGKGACFSVFIPEAKGKGQAAFRKA